VIDGAIGQVWARHAAGPGGTGLAGVAGVAGVRA